MPGEIIILATLALIPLAIIGVRIWERWSRVRWYQDVLRSGSDVDDDPRAINLLGRGEVIPMFGERDSRNPTDNGGRRRAGQSPGFAKDRVRTHDGKRSTP
jgi:hypothetical protein